MSNGTMTGGLRAARLEAILHYVSCTRFGITLDAMGKRELADKGFNWSEAQSLLDELEANGKVQIFAEGPWVRVRVSGQEVAA